MITLPNSEFDTFAENYEDIHNQSISLSGEDSLFFVELKMKLLQECFPDFINQKISILDYGCGTGRSAQFVLRYFPSSSLVGVDPSAKSIEVARRIYPSVNFEILTPDSKILKKQSFDLIFAAGVFHHLTPEEQHKALETITHSLKPGGYFVLFEHNPYNPLTVRVVQSCPFDKGVVLLKPRYSRKLCEDAGLNVEQQRYYFFFPKMLSFLRPSEKLLKSIPLGAQYFIVSKKTVAGKIV